MLRIDARIPLRFDDASGAGAEDAVLVEDGLVVPGAEGRQALGFSPGGAHPAGCACCVARSPGAMALAALFQMRARGEIGFFRAVVVQAGPEGRAEIEAALVSDPLAAGRFRLA